MDLQFTKQEISLNIIEKGTAHVFQMNKDEFSSKLAVAKPMKICKNKGS